MKIIWKISIFFKKNNHNKNKKTSNNLIKIVIWRIILLYQIKILNISNVIYHQIAIEILKYIAIK